MPTRHLSVPPSITANDRKNVQSSTSSSLREEDLPSFHTASSREENPEPIEVIILRINELYEANARTKAKAVVVSSERTASHPAESATADDGPSEPQEGASLPDSALSPATNLSSDTSIQPPIQQRRERSLKLQSPQPKRTAPLEHSTKKMTDGPKKRKTDSLDPSNLAQSAKRACRWRPPLSSKGTRIFLQGGRDWVEAYQAEFSERMMLIAQGRLRDHEAHGTREMPIILGDNDDDSTAMFSELSSSSRLLGLMVLESRNPELDRRTDGLTVLRWGEPAFVEKQKQTIQEQIFLLQKAYHCVRTLNSLKGFDFSELAHKIEETLEFTERRLSYDHVVTLGHAWRRAQEQLQTVLVRPKDKDLVARLGELISAVRDELWVWKLLEDERCVAAKAHKK